MPKSRLSDRVFGWVRRQFSTGHSAVGPRRGPVDHVIILDGTMSSLRAGCETNAGLIYKLLQQQGHASLFYEAGVQWIGWRGAWHVITGRGINRQIRRAYGYLASRYRPGDRIFLLGYSRGAYAVRSLAGIIDKVGLVRHLHATERNIQNAYRLYQSNPDGAAAAAFSRAFCYEATPVEMLGVFDTVKALGLRVPVLWRLVGESHAFHNHALGDGIRHGFHALALNETRAAYSPVLWDCPADWPGQVEQVWFRGTHGDVGGQLNGFEAARPLANIPLVWMLERMQRCGLELPADWRARFPCDAAAPSLGLWRGWAKCFVLRQRRAVGADRSEHVHASVDSPTTNAAKRVRLLASSHSFTNS